PSPRGGAAEGERRSPLDHPAGGDPRRLGLGAHHVLSALARERSGSAAPDAPGTARRPRGPAERRRPPRRRSRLSSGRGRNLRDRHQRARRRRLARGLPAPGRVDDAMDVQTGLLLFGAGVAGGIVTAMVGGASLITFPALLASGLPAVVANASNPVALTPGNLVAALADVERLPRWDRSLLGVAGVCAAGSIAGAALLLLTPE